MLKILRSRFLWPMPLLIAASNISSAFHCSFRFLLYFFFGFYFVPSVFTMFSHFNVNKLSLFSPVFNKRFERIKILSKSHYRMQFIMPFMSQVYSPTIRYTNCWTTNTEWRMHDRKHKFLHYRQLSNKKHNTLKWDEKNEHGNFSAQQIECDQKIREIKKYTWHGTWIEEEKNVYQTTYIEEMRSQTANRIFCNICRQCVYSCPEGKHIDLLVHIWYPCWYAISKHLQFYFGWYFIQFRMNKLSG